MGQGASHPHPIVQEHRQPHWAMDTSSEPTHSPHQVRQRVQHQQQQREMREQLEREQENQLLQQEGIVDAGCCGSEAAASCSCGGGLTSTAAIYGTAASPDPATHHPVVVTPPRSLPHHHHHHHHHHRHQLQQAEAATLPTAAGSASGPSCASSGACSSSSNNGCGHWCSSCRVRVQVEVECVNGIEARPSPPRGGRLRTLTFPKRHRHKTKTPTRDLPAQPKKKKTPWTFRLNCRLRPSKSEPEPEASTSVGCGACMCPSLRRPEPELHTHHHHHHHVPHHHHLHHRHPSGQDSPSIASVGSGTASSPGGAVALRAPVIDLSRFNPDAYPIEDWDEQARQERAREMAEGVEPPPGFGSSHTLTPAHHALTHLQLQHQHQLQLQQAGAVTPLPLPYNSVLDLQLLLERSLRLGLGGPRSVAASISEETLLQQVGRLAGDGSLLQRTVHTQVDYIHCLVPDLLRITNCAFYWGKMDRYEAERLLDNRPEGTFLLRDSAQEEYLFSVSFRRYGRSLHARIEQWNHKFSFDSHDPGVFASDTVCGLIEHYKDPSCCMFFEPMLTNPLARTFPFPLQHLCRAVICSTTTYDGINSLLLPKSLNNYLKEYHYKQRVRVRRLDH
ncbi:uncharacterized protein [Macrobrachium rosenbergii]|uniref:uncharacterized protein n=1 Tax=Macrobrachium rosenbergii TaxID=79674 RepID=UPI0034D3A3B0